MTDEEYMQEAIKEAKKAASIDEVPVGCVIVKDGEIIARAHNMKEHKQNVIAHAEMLAIKQASLELHNWHLDGCDMYVTLEPCTMCIGAAINARIKRLVYGASDEKTGACGSVLNIPEEYKFNHIVEIEKNVEEEKCKEILQTFFKELRKRKEKNNGNK